MTATEHRSHYRTTFEVLRDVLRATRTPCPKTRILGLANLNHRSFRAYFRFCTEHRLISSTSRGFVVTQRGRGVRDALDEVLARATDLEGAVRRLERIVVVVRPPDGPREAHGTALRPLSRLVRKELLPPERRRAEYGSDVGVRTWAGPGRPRTSHPTFSGRWRS